VTAMLVTHDQHEAFAFADIIGVMNQGRLLQWDSAFDLYHRPASRFVADFIGQGVLIDAVVRDERSLQTELGEVRGELSCRLPPGSEVELLPSHHNHRAGEQIGIRLSLDHLVIFPRDV